MPKCCSRVLDLFSHADIFRFPLTLTLNRSEKTGTRTGKFITSAILVYILYSFIVSEMVNKINPRTLMQNLNQLPRPTMTFSKQNLTMALGVTDDQNVFYVDDTTFSILMYIESLDFKTHETKERVYTLQPCTKEDFIENPMEFEKLGLNGTYCLPNEVLRLRGFWDEPQIEYFYFELRMCLNSTTSNITCKPKEDRDDFLKNKYFQVYYTDNHIDLSDYSNLISRNLKAFYRRIDPKLLKSLNFYFENCNVYTDDNFLYASWNRVNTYIFGEIELDFTLDQAQNENLAFVFNVYSSNLQLDLKREYEKIGSLLAQIGGICNFMFFFGILLSKFENRYNLTSLLGNELFIFPNLAKKRNDFIKYSETKKFHLQEGEKPEPEQLFTPNKNSIFTPNKISIFTPNKISIFTPNKVSLKTENNGRDMKLIKRNIGSKEFDKNQKTMKTENSRLSHSFTEIPLFHQKTSFKSEIFGLRKFERLESQREDKTKPISTSDDGIPLEFHESESAFVEDSPTQRISFQKSIHTVRNHVSKTKKEGNYLEHYQKLKQQENKFHLGFWGWLKYFYKKKFRSCTSKLTTRERLFQQSERQVEDELDILHILKKLQDVEKLKRVLLNDEQLFFFNLLSKPMITINNMESSDDRFRFTLSKRSSMYRATKIFEKYNSIKESKKVSDIDKRILKLLDDDVSRFLKNEIAIES